MKIFLFSCLATAAFLSFSACEADDEHRHDHERGARTTTTTTEETTTRQPAGPITETRTTRSY